MKRVRRFYAEYVRRHWRKLLVAFLLTATVNQAPYAFSMLGKWLVDDVLQVGPRRAASVPGVEAPAEVPLDDKVTSLLFFLAISLGLRIGTAGFGALSGYLTSSTGQRVLFRLRSTVQQRLSHLPLSYFDRYSTGQLMVRVMEDANAAQANTVNLPVNVATQVVTLVVGIVLIWRISPEMTLIALAVLPFYALGSGLFMGALRKNTEAVRNANSDLQALLEERLTHVATVKYYAQEQSESERFFSQLSGNLKLAWRQNGLNTGLSVVLMIVSGLGATGVLMYGFWQLRDGTMLLGEVLAVYQMAALLFGPVTTLTNTSVVLQTTSVVLARLYEVLDAQSEVVDAADALDVPIQGRITFENVTFRYLEAGPVSLRNVSFDLAAGQTLALLGPSGCGKSSIVNLLLRFYDTTEGTIRIDGHDIRKVRLQRLREAIGVASQEARVFSGSVAQNIAFGDPDILDDVMENAARIAGCHEAIQALPRGYQTLVGKGGEALSQDLVQRIAIARALVGETKIFVFDDSASAMSEEEEEALYASVEEVFKEQTLLIVTNRVRTAENADMIAVLRDGEIVELGGDADLKAARGIYWRMFLHQTERPGTISAEVRLTASEDLSQDHTTPGIA